MMKKLLSWVLTLAMVVSLMPTVAFAEEDAYELGDIFTSADRNETPPTAIPEYTEWSGPA